MKKYEYTNPKHKKFFRKYKIKAFPTIVVAKGTKVLSRTTGFRKAAYILKLKGANDAKKTRDDGRHRVAGGR